MKQMGGGRKIVPLQTNLEERMHLGLLLQNRDARRILMTVAITLSLSSASHAIPAFVKMRNLTKLLVGKRLRTDPELQSQMTQCKID